MDKDDIPRELGLIVNRRSKIAYEADIDSIINDKTPIDQAIIEVKTFIVKLATPDDKKL